MAVLEAIDSSGGIGRVHVFCYLLFRCGGDRRGHGELETPMHNRRNPPVQSCGLLAVVGFCPKIEPKVVNLVPAGLKFAYLPNHGC